MFQEWLKKLDAATDRNMRRTIVELAALYDDFVLIYDTVPDEAFDFLVNIFSDERVLRAQGIEYFLIELNVDFCKYTQGQREKILAVLVQNIKLVSDNLGRHSIGDFVARAYPPEVAYGTFLSLAGRSNSETHVAFVGLDVLRKRVPKEGTLYSKIVAKWEEISNASL